MIRIHRLYFRTQHPSTGSAAPEADLESRGGLLRSLSTSNISMICEREAAPSCRWCVGPTRGDGGSCDWCVGPTRGDGGCCGCWVGPTRGEGGSCRPTCRRRASTSASAAAAAAGERRGVRRPRLCGVTRTSRLRQRAGVSHSSGGTGAAPGPTPTLNRRPLS